MANDPNRDLLPVKEDSCKTGKGFSGKFDHQLLGKLSRCELEDRFLRLLDEQTHIKKLANSQEEKIKRLGTKLLRLIYEKKNGRKLLEQSKETEDLHLRIIELEHENYALKDKNTVLKQQLSNHSRQLLTHRSPNRSNHTSPLMTTRQSAGPTQSEIAYETNKTAAADMQLQEAEAHIRELNEEIKSLHCKIDCLQQNLEKNCLDTRKSKVSENIELIRLQRSLKQQSIQIASLQAQVKNSENNQKLLKEELIKAHNENDEALHLISVKQGEILNLCSKLEEKNLNRLEEDELKSRINDLMLERDCLKERSEFLMKSIASKAKETEKIIELQKQLAEEKCQKEKLEEALELCKQNYLKTVEKSCPESLENKKIKTVDRAQQTLSSEEKEFTSLFVDSNEESECSCNKCNNVLSVCKCSQESFLSPELESDTETTEPIQEKVAEQKPNSTSLGKNAAEKMKLERELRYLRDMLRSQTQRCESQQTEISRLMYELKMNEEKCNETLQRLDWHLRIFQTFEMTEFEAIMRMKQSERVAKPILEPARVKPEAILEKREPVRERLHSIREKSEPDCEKAEPVRERPEPVRRTFSIRGGYEPVHEKSDSICERSEPANKKSDSIRERSEPAHESSDSIRERFQAKRESSDSIRERFEAMRESSESISESFKAVRERSGPVQDGVVLMREISDPVREKSESGHEKFEKNRSKPEVVLEKLEFRTTENDSKTETSRKSPRSTYARRKQSLREDNVIVRPTFLEKTTPEKETSDYHVKTDQKNRFVDQKFLDSSDEEIENMQRTFKSSYSRKLESLDDDDITFSKISSKHDSDDSQTHWMDRPKKLTKLAPAKKASSISWFSNPGSEHVVQQTKRTEKKKGSLRYDIDLLDKPLKVKIYISWFQMEPKSSFWKKKKIEMFFIDFTFLDVNGAETETPNSLPKPKSGDEKCYFDFSQTIEIQGSKLEMFNSLLTKNDLAIIVFKLVSDSVRFDETNDECEDFGVAVVTVKEFLEFKNQGLFTILVKDIENTKDVIGALSVSIETTQESF